MAFAVSGWGCAGCVAPGTRLVPCWAALPKAKEDGAGELAAPKRDGVLAAAPKADVLAAPNREGVLDAPNAAALAAPNGAGVEAAGCEKRDGVVVLPKREELLAAALPTAGHEQTGQARCKRAQG